MIGELNEIILYVEDMQKQFLFYRDVLELEVITPTESEDWSQEYWILFAAGSCQLALHGGGKK